MAANELSGKRQRGDDDENSESRIRKRNLLGRFAWWLTPREIKFKPDPSLTIHHHETDDDDNDDGDGDEFLDNASSLEDDTRNNTANNPVAVITVPTRWNSNSNSNSNHSQSQPNRKETDGDASIGFSSSSSSSSSTSSSSVTSSNEDSSDDDEKEGKATAIISTSSSSSTTKFDGQQQQQQQQQPQTPYTYEEFLDILHYCEDFFGETAEKIEDGPRVRGANQKMCQEDTDGQGKAQYGRILPEGVHRLMTNVLDFNPDDVFLDIGHGIGLTCLQVAVTAGCEARGIEVVYSRNSIAEVFSDRMQIYHNAQQSRRPQSQHRIMGNVFLQHGRLEDPNNRDFLTVGVTKAFYNNYNSVFAVRSDPKTKCFLDDYCAAIFASMAPGAILVTFDKLTLGPTRKEANAHRVQHDLKESEMASFFSMDKLYLGQAKDTVKWNQNSGNKEKIYVYKYTRLSQGDSPDAVFLCSNKKCEVAQQNIAIPAITFNEEGRCVINKCTKCNITQKNLRRPHDKKKTAKGSNSA